MKHLLSVEQTSREDIEKILRRTADFKTKRGQISARPILGQTWALIFSKPSTRTRVSFEVGIRELGGRSIYLNASDAQLGRGELIKDTARVLARMVPAQSFAPPRKATSRNSPNSPASRRSMP